MSDDKESMLGKVTGSTKTGIYLNGTTLGLLLLGGGKAYDYLDKQLEALENLATAVAKVQTEQQQAAVAQAELVRSMDKRGTADDGIHDELRKRIAVLESCTRAPKACPLR